MRKQIFILMIGLILMTAQGAAMAAVGPNWIEQWGITWTFDKDISTDDAGDTYQYGTFANGDYWVVGPVTIVSIDPQSIVVQVNDNGTTIDRVINGSMINPTPVSGDLQGYDSEMYCWHPTAGRAYPDSSAYSEQMNVARIDNAPINSNNPRIVSTGSSLISTISAFPTSRPTLQDAAVLTVLDSPAPEGSFRPPYSGTNKTIQFNINHINYNTLSNLPEVPNTPSLSSLEDKFDELWLDHVPSWHGRYLHPVDSMPDYSRDFAQDVGDAALRLNINASNNEKETLLIYLVQLGIDNYRNMQLGASLTYGNWPPMEGQNMGRKLPIVFAGRVLGNSEMLNIGRWQSGIEVGNFNPVFQEDLNVFIVAQSDVNEVKIGVNGIDEQYTMAHIGLPEWGSRHYGPYSNTLRDDASLTADYRDIAAVGIIGHALTIHIMGLKEAWQNDVFFNYLDRWWAFKNNGNPPVQTITTFTKNMWDAYRADYGPIWPDTGSPKLYGDVSENGTITATDASMAARYAVDLISLTASQITAADVTGNGSVGATDASWIARRAVGDTVVFPVEQ